MVLAPTDTLLRFHQRSVVVTVQVYAVPGVRPVSFAEMPLAASGTAVPGFTAPAGAAGNRRTVTERTSRSPGGVHDTVAVSWPDRRDAHPGDAVGGHRVRRGCQHVPGDVDDDVRRAAGRHGEVGAAVLVDRHDEL